MTSAKEFIFLYTVSGTGTAVLFYHYFIHKQHWLAMRQEFLKFFPAEAAGGVKMLKSIIAPYRHLGIRFMPTGGVTSANAADYLAIKEVAAIGGTWLGKAEDIKAENWDAVAKTVKAAVELKNHFA